MATKTNKATTTTTTKAKAKAKAERPTKGVRVEPVRADDAGEPINQTPVVLHVFAEGVGYLIMRADGTLLQAVATRAEAGRWVRDQVPGADIVETAPACYTPKPLEPTHPELAKPAKVEPATASDVAVREIGDDRTIPDAKAHGLDFKFLGRPVKSKAAATASAIAAGLSSKVGEPGAVLVGGHGRDGDCWSVGFYFRPEEKPVAAPKAPKAPKAASEPKAPKAAGELATTAKLRWFGAMGASVAEAMLAVVKTGEPEPNKATALTQVRAGAKGLRGGKPTTSEAQARMLAAALQDAQAELAKLAKADTKSATAAS